MNRTVKLVALVMFAAASYLSAGDATSLSIRIKPTDSKLRYSGRFTDDYRFGWTACNIGLRFKGTAVNAVLKLCKGRKTAFQIVVDGKPTRTLFVTQKQSTYAIATDLKSGEHTVELWKRPEGCIGEIKFGGFQLSKDAQLLSLKSPERRILVVGDSISCGYGNEAKSKGEGNTVENENGYMAYGPIAARQLQADIMMVCWSGRGMYRDRGDKNDKESTLPILFDQTLPLSKDAKWDHSKYVPDVIVINLGTNDLHRGSKKQKPELAKEKFLGAYRSFIKRLRTLYPKTRIIAAIGPMALKPITEWLPDLEASEKDVYYLEFAGKHGKEYFGGHWHPTVKMNRIMAETLVGKIKTITSWK